MTFAEKLIEVANNRPKLYKKGALDYSPQETVSGEAIGITDALPIEHNMGVKVKCQNLLNEKAVAPIVINADGWTRYGWDLGVLPQGTYTLTVFGNYVNAKSVSYKTITNGVYSEYQSLTESKKSATITLNGSQGFVVYLYQGVTDLYDNVTLMLNEGTTATSYAPYIEDISTVKLYKGGKNLVKFPDSRKNFMGVSYESGQTVQRNGITYTVQEDGGIYAVGTAEGSSSTFIFAQDYYFGYLLPYQFPYNGSINGGANGASKGGVSVSKRLYWQGDGTRNILYLYFPAGTTVDEVFYPQVEFSNAPTEYEPYIEPTVYDVNADGTVEGVTSLYPSTTLYTDTSGAVVDCTYYQDGKKVKENLIEMIVSLGGVINE